MPITLLHPGPDSPPPTALPHILLVVDQLPHRLGGGERIVLRQAQHLPAHGYRASILTFAAHPDSPALINPPCPIYLLPLTRTWDLNALRGALALRRFLRRQHIRLVETFFESSDIWAGTVTRLLSPARLVWNRRDMGILRSPKHFAAYRRLRNLPHHVFVVSDEVRRYTELTDGVPPHRITTVHNGLDLATWQSLTPTPPPRDTPRIVTLGNLRRIKGHDTLLLAFAEVLKQFPQATLEIGGGTLEPNFLAELHHIIDTHHMQSSVHLVGSIDGTPAQQAFLSRATLFVLPSRSEGFSNAIIEAMAAGLPVIATRVGGNAEAVLAPPAGGNAEAILTSGTERETGLIIRPDNPAALAAALLTLLHDPARCAAMSHAARTRVATLFTTDAMLRATTAVFDRLLAGR